MAIAFFDLIVLPIWPLALSGAIWAVAHHALCEKDTLSAIVRALTEPKEAGETEAIETEAITPRPPADHTIGRGLLAAQAI